MKSLIKIIFLLFPALNLTELKSQIIVNNDIELIHLRDSIYMHKTFHEFPFGRYPSNGLVIIKNGKAVMVDTPVTIEQTKQLTDYLKDSIHVKVEKIIAAHYHVDCIGGLEYLHQSGVHSIASDLTKQICIQKKLPVPEQSFRDELDINFQGIKIICQYFGPGHTDDIIVIWLPDYGILFGGDMVKTAGAKGMGNITEANLVEWDLSLKKIQKEYQDIKFVVPGHGDFGSEELLGHTISLIQNYRQEKIKECFSKRDIDGCLVLYDQQNDTYIRYNSGLCNKGYIPASTFKIPHAIIAFEEGVIKDTTEIIKWNGYEWPHKVWNRDQTLKTSMEYSCIWVYFGFAEQIGIDKYYEYVNAFDYGNKDLTGPPTRFWLNGNFRISANQQIDFLRKFYNYELPVSKHSIDLVKGIIIKEQGENYRISGKTGAGEQAEGPDIMWFVGYLEKGDRPYFFALNFIANEYKHFAQMRFEMSKEILSELKLIP